MRERPARWSGKNAADIVVIAEGSVAATEIPAEHGFGFKIAELRRLGFTDPVKMITTHPAIASYSAERLNVAGEIVANLDDRSDAMFKQLIVKRRAVIDSVRDASPKCWADVLAIMGAKRKESRQ